MTRPLQFFVGCPQILAKTGLFLLRYELLDVKASVRARAHELAASAGYMALAEKMQGLVAELIEKEGLLVLRKRTDLEQDGLRESLVNRVFGIEDV